MSKGKWFEEETVDIKAAKVMENSQVKDDDDKLNIVYPVRLSLRLQSKLQVQSKLQGLSQQAYIRKLIHDN